MNILLLWRQNYSSKVSEYTVRYVGSAFAYSECHTPALHIVKFINSPQEVMMTGIDLFVRSLETDFKLNQLLKL